MLDFTQNDRGKKKSVELNSTDIFLNNLPDSIWAIDRDFRYLIANDNFKRDCWNALGISIEIGRDLRENLPQEIIDFWVPRYERAFLGEKYQFDYFYVLNGENRYFEINISPIYYNTTEIYGATIVSREVTKRKNIENKYLSTQNDFANALLFSKMGSWELDLTTFQLSLSKHKQIILDFENIFDSPISIALSDYAQRFIHPDDIQIIQNALGLLIENRGTIGYSIQLDYRCITFKGNLKYFDLKCYVKDSYTIFGFTQDISDRKLAEIKSDENQKLYEQLIETLPDMILLHRNGIILFANETLYKRTGFSKEEVIGKSIMAFDRPENHKNTEKVLTSRAKGEKVPDYELVLPTKFGSVLQLRVKSSEVHIQQELTTLIVFEDITYLKESKQKIEDKNALLTSVINSPTKTIIFSLDTKYCYTSFNENHKNMMRFLWNCDIEIGKCILDYITIKKDVEKAKNNFNRALAGESFQLIEEYGETPNRLFYENAYNPIKDENGDITGLTVFLFDITSLKRTEEALIRSQKEVNIIFENSFDAVFLVDELSLKIIRCNKRAVSLFEVENKQIITHQLGYSYFIPNDLLYHEIENSLNEGKIWQEELEYVTAKGNLFWGLLSIKKISDLSNFGFFIVKISDISQRKNAERKLLEKQKQLEAIIENTEDFIWLIDNNYRLLNANSAFRNSILKNHNLQLVEGVSLVEDIPTVSEGDIILWKKWYDEALSGIAFIQENSYTINEEVFYWENALYPVKEGDRIIGVAVLSRNITARKHKEEEIRRSEEQLKFAIEATKEGVWDWNLITQQLQCNQAWYDILQFEPHEISYTKDDILNQILEEDRAEIFNILWQVSKGEKEFFECEYRVKTKKGEIIWVRDRGSIVEKQTNGEAKRIVGTLEKITERKLIELALQSQQKFIKKVINAVPSLIFVKDSEGRFILVNNAFAKYYNTDVKSIIGKRDIDLVKNHYALSVYEESDNLVLSTGKTISLPETQSIDDKSGEISYYQTVKVLLTINENEKQILGVATNVTDRKKAEAEKVKLLNSLMQNVQDLEQFTYMVSHNLRSHVARILGLASLLDKENKDNPFNDYIFTTVVDEATRLDAIIVDLNTIVAVRNSNDEKREEISLKETCEAVLLSLKMDIEKCQADVRVKIPKKSKIYTIKTYTYSIILNLLSNALKYRSLERPLQLSIRASTSADQKYLCLSVKDNGLGINLSQNKDKIFGLYHRFHSHVEGKGIGLHITKTQIERMGGKIEIESELNVGTTFKVYFPL